MVSISNYVNLRITYPYTTNIYRMMDKKGFNSILYVHTVVNL